MMCRWTMGLVVVGLLGLVACGGGGGTGVDGGGSLKVYVTDAPFPKACVESATVKIREVRARNQEAEGWQVLFEGEAVVDLVPLTGGITSLLADIEVPAGSYDEIRLIVDAGEVVFAADAHVDAAERTFSTENGNLKFPSGSQSGIKVKIDEPIVVTTGLSSAVTLDFDLQDNFRFNGSPEYAPGVKRVIFTPVIRAVNNTTAGTITAVLVSTMGTEGDTSDDLAPETAMVIVKNAEDEVVAKATPADDGQVSIALLPGAYDVSFKAFGHEMQLVTAVMVELGNVNDLGTIRLSPAADIHGVVTSDAGTADTADDTVIVGATVSLVLTSDPTATPLVTTTDEDGVYWFESLVPDSYDLDFSADGHDDSLTIPVVVGVDESKAKDVVLLTTP